jgi:cyclopropane fatty-acyl-phospholipid synthase-like methyltransferase
MQAEKVWEFRTEEEMQRALAGVTARDEYLKNREQMADLLAALFCLDSTQRGFEIGSGEGVVAKHLALRCRSLDCADISDSFLVKAQQTCEGNNNIRFHKIATDYLDFLESNVYEFGYSLNVFIHFNAYDIFHYLKSVRKLLKSGGAFFFTATTIGESTRDLFHYFADQYRMYPDPVLSRGYMTWIDMPLLQAIIKESGLVFVADRSSNEGGHLRIVVQKQ